MSYVSGSEGPSVSGYDVQGPKALPGSAFPKATVPTVKIVYEPCNSIIVNADSGSIHILPVEHTASVGTTLTDDDAGGTRGDGNKFIEVFNTDVTSHATSFELPIVAQAWSGSGGATTGNVTFVYRGGL